MNIMFLIKLHTHKFAGISYCIFGELLGVMEVNVLESSDYLFLASSLRASGLVFESVDI